MLSSKVNEIAVNGALPTFSSHGCYPIFYVNNHNDVLCADCANQHEDFDETIVDYDVNYEDCTLCCDHCSKYIDPAYIVDEELQIARFGDTEFWN